MIVDGSAWGRVSQAKEGRQGGCSHHPEHSAALVDDPVSPWRTLGRLAAIPHCGITSTKCSSLALVGRGGSLQHSLLGGPMRQELCPGPSQGKAGRFLFVFTSLSSERIDGDIQGYYKTNKCRGRQWCKACCLHETTRRKSHSFVTNGSQICLHAWWCL